MIEQRSKVKLWCQFGLIVGFLGGASGLYSRGRIDILLDKLNNKYRNTMKVDVFIEKLSTKPEQVEFNDVIAVISANYHYQPCTFSNGDLTNESGSNEGSCKIFAFAKLHGLSEGATLACFGQYYREDVLLHPEGIDHRNIRNFIKQGWQGLNFEGEVLS